MSDRTHAPCSLCAKPILRLPNTRIVHVNFERLFHLNCFVAFTTGSRRDDIWTYRIVGAGADASAQSS